MSYKTIYTIPFKSKNEHSYKVEIQKKGYTGNATTLTASGDAPFVCSIDDEKFVYTPTRLSTATIRIVGNDYLQELYSVGYQQFRVTLLCDGVVSWCGFIKPEIYTQEYKSTVFELEIECVSAFLSLDNISYTRTDAGTLSFISIMDLLRRAITASNGRYQSVYMPHVYARSQNDYSLSANVLSSMTLSEQNFFDEDGKAMKWMDVVSEICKFLNWTCCDWCGSLYFLDVDHRGQYYKYNTSLSSYSYVEFNELQINNIGFSGSEHTLDIIGGYNKATVKCSNYPIKVVVPDEDFDELHVVKTMDYYKDNDQKVCRLVFLSPDKWSLKLFDGAYNVIPNTELEDYKNSIPILEGATLARYCVYNQSKGSDGKLKPDITDYSYTDVIRINPVASNANVERLRYNKAHVKALSFKGASSTYSDGAIAISGSLKVLKDTIVPWGNSASSGKNELACQIRIGDMYYGNKLGDSMEGYVWSADKDNHVLLRLDSFNNDNSLDYIPIENQKTLSMPYTGLRGFIIPIDKLLSGEFEFSLFVLGKQIGSTAGYMIKDFKVSYQKKDGIAQSNSDSDRIYENVPNENYINELEDIVLKISSYNNDGACYGKVLLGGAYLTNNLYSSIPGEAIRPEEQLLNRIINQYCATKILLTQIIKNDFNITPLTRMRDRHMSGKKFIIIGGEIDYYADSFACKMIELNGN